MTNSGAPTWRMFRVDPAHAERDKWQEIVPARPDATLDSVLDRRRQALAPVPERRRGSRRGAHLDGAKVREIQLPGLGNASALVGDPDDDLAYYSFESFTQPSTIFETQLSSGASKQYYQPKVPIDATKFIVEQEKFRSKDGTTVPMFVIHAKDRKKDGAAPTILYGYGGFQVAETPSFSSSIFPWIERAASTRSRTCAAATSTARSGTRPGCATRSRTSSTTSSPRPRTSIKLQWTSKRQARRARRLERRPPRRRRGDAAARSLPRRALRRAAHRHGALPPVRLGQDLGRGVRLRRGRERTSRRSTPIRRTTTSCAARSTPRCSCSRPTATIASIRCTRANSPPRSRPRPRAGSCSCASRSTRDTAAQISSRPASKRSPTYAFAWSQVAGN